MSIIKALFLVSTTLVCRCVCVWDKCLKKISLNPNTDDDFRMMFTSPTFRLIESCEITHLNKISLATGLYTQVKVVLAWRNVNSIGRKLRTINQFQCLVKRETHETEINKNLSWETSRVKEKWGWMRMVMAESRKNKTNKRKVKRGFIQWAISSLSKHT